MAGLEAALRPFVDSGAVPGLVALVARGDDVELAVLGEAASGHAMARGSIVRGASITKPVMAVLAMALVEDGVLDLDAPIDALPELTDLHVLRTPTAALDDTVPLARPVTARHLLTSTWGSGFTTVDSPVVPRLVEELGQSSMDVAAVPPPDEWVRRLSAIPLVHQPGEGWTYNLAHDVLGVLLARVTGRDLAGLLRDRVLDPLGMVDTGFRVPAASLDRFTTLRSHDDAGALQVADPVDGAFASPPAFASGAGGLVTTVDDQLAFGRMLLAGGADLLSPESVRLVMTDHTTPQQREMGGFFLDGQGWGFGGGVDTSVRTPWNVVGRYGWVGGTGTATYVDPVHEVVSVLLTQVTLGGPASGEVLEAFWRAAARS